MPALRQWLSLGFSLAGFALAAESFAVWALFSLPLMTGRAGIREAWDTAPYWLYGIPLLLLSLAIAGFFSRKEAWLLALYAAAGHVLAIAIVAKGGADLGLLPLAVVMVGVPMFAAFIGMAYVGGWLQVKLRG